MRPLVFILTRAILAATMAACFVVAGCGQGSGEGSSGSADRTAGAHAAQTSAKGGAPKGGPKPLGIGAKNEEPVPNVVGKPIEAACRTLSRAGHAGEVSYVRSAEGVEPGRVLAQDIEPGTNKGASLLVYLTVSGPFSEKELSANTFCANPQPDIDDAAPRGGRH
jgi:PASTA domain